MTPHIIDIDPLVKERNECGCLRDGDWECSRCRNKVPKARRHNASARQAAKLGLSDRIQINNGSWVVDERFWWYPQAKKWRRVGGKEYYKVKNFETFCAAVGIGKLA